MALKKRTVIIGICIVVALFMIREASRKMMPASQTGPAHVNPPAPTPPAASASAIEQNPMPAKEEAAPSQAPAEPAKQTPEKFEILVQ